MVTRLLAAALAACALTSPSPPALADEPVYDCEFYGEASGAGTWIGVVAGHVAHVEGGAVAITCEIKVNGATVDSLTGTGDAVAWVVEPVAGFAFVDDIDLCSYATTSHGTSTRCEDMKSTGSPDLPETSPCTPFLVANDVVPDVLGVLETRDDGDVYVLDEHFWDCPPYEPWRLSRNITNARAG